MSRHSLRLILRLKRSTLTCALLAVALAGVSLPGCNLPTEQPSEQQMSVRQEAGAPWRDLWDPEWVEVMNQQTLARIQPSDTHVMGHYSDNELDWWNGALFRETLNHRSTSGQRQRLVALLQ
jgi:hypothetical protein